MSQSAEKSRWTGRWGPSQVLGAPRKTTNAGGQGSSQLGSSDGGRYSGVVKIKPPLQKPPLNPTSTTLCRVTLGEGFQCSELQIPPPQSKVNKSRHWESSP